MSSPSTSTMSSSSSAPSSSPRRPASRRSDSSSSIDSTTSSPRNSLLFQLPALSDLPHSEYLSSTDPLSQNFSFDDIFDYDNTSAPPSHKVSGSAQRKKATTSIKNQVMATHPRAPILPGPSSRRSHQRQHNQSTTSSASTESTSTSTASKKQQQRQQAAPTPSNFSFSHYPPIPQDRRTSTARRGSAGMGGIPSRTSPGAARLHEMLARGR